MKKFEPFEECSMRKGGLNEKPTRPRPNTPPKGQGGNNVGMNMIKEYLVFYKRCYKDEKKHMTELPQLVEFRKGKAYEMELVMKDLQRILDGDIFFRDSKKEEINVTEKSSLREMSKDIKTIS